MLTVVPSRMLCLAFLAVGNLVTIAESYDNGRSLLSRFSISSKLESLLEQAALNRLADEFLETSQQQQQQQQQSSSSSSSSKDKTKKNDNYYSDFQFRLQKFVKQGAHTSWSIIQSLAHVIMDDDTIQAVRTVRKVLASVQDYGVENVFRQDYTKKELMYSIYALSRLQHGNFKYNLQQINNSTSTLPPTKEEASTSATTNVSTSCHHEDVDSELLQELKYYVPFATAAYGWTLQLATAGKFHQADNTNSLIQQLSSQKDNDQDNNNNITIIHEDWDGCPSFFIVKDQKHKNIVLSIRGTWSARDVLTDLCCTPAQFQSTLVHSGALQAAQSIKEQAQQIIQQALCDNPGYNLLLVGHSLGGSVAALLGMIWDKEQTFAKSPTCTTTITVYTYGPACCIAQQPNTTSKNKNKNNNNNNNDNNRNLNIVSVIGQGDPFCCLSLGHVADVSMAISELCQNDQLRESILIRTDDMQQQDIQWCHDTLSNLHKQKLTGIKLYPPGQTLIYLGKSQQQQQDNDKKSTKSYKRGSIYKAHVVQPEFFQNLCIGPRMFDLSRHIPQLYEARLQNCLRHHYRIEANKQS